MMLRFAIPLLAALLLAGGHAAAPAEPACLVLR
jgi:hypothetical protein